MRVFTAKDNNAMANLVYNALNDYGVGEATRNGPVIRFEEPVTMCYTRPSNRMNFTPGRKANPFFHLAESAWMLAGRRDVSFLSKFNSKIYQYSDDGEVYNAAYGYRLRRHFGHDQLQETVQMLKSSPNSRQAVMQLWDDADLIKSTKDKACNLILLPSIVNNALQLTVFNRSNDAVFGGVTGANPVHMSFFQQYMADQLGLPMGKLYMVSNNLHVYTELYDFWIKMDWNQVFSIENTYHSIGGLDEYENLCNEVEEKNIVRTIYKSPMIENLIKPVINVWLLRKVNLSWKPWLLAIRCPATLKACSDFIAGLSA